MQRVNASEEEKKGRTLWNGLYTRSRTILHYNGVAGQPVQNRLVSVYETNTVIVKGIMVYCAIKNAGRCSAVPSGECICVRDTYESPCGISQTHFKADVKSRKPAHQSRGSRKTR